MENIKAEEADYFNYPIPKFYNFDSEDSKERILYSNFDRIDSEVKTMIKVIQTEKKKSGGSQVAPRKATIKTNKNKSILTSLKKKKWCIKRYIISFF